MVQVGSIWVGVNTSLTNKLVREALENGIIKEFGVPDKILQEVKTSAKTRLDFAFEFHGKQTYMEVKNCSLAEDRIAMFPDAVTLRGKKHLLELDMLHHQGHGAAVFFCVQREDVDHFSPAADIDPAYAKTLKQVAEEGIMVLAYIADVSPREIKVTRKIPVKLT
jgi:sugar fermentation stimulation protein A